MYGTRIVTTFTLVLVATTARADVGFKPINGVRVWVTRAGRPLDRDFSAALLEVRPEGNMRSRPFGNPRRVPAFDAFLKAQSGHDRLTFCSYSWGGAGHDGQVSFRQFIGDMPEQVYLLVYLPAEDRTYLTTAAPVDAPIRHFRADLHEDGSGSLELVRLPFWHTQQFYQAIFVTLALELAVVAVVARRRQWPLTRLLVVSLIGSLLTLPVVWLVMLLPYGDRDFSVLAVIGTLVAAEAGAIVFEGLLFAWLGKLGWARGFALALVANAVSMLVGLII